MAKKIRERAKKALKAARSEAVEDDHGGPQPPSRLQRKLLKKIAFVEKLHAGQQRFAKASGVQKKRAKGRRASAALADFSGFADSLPDIIVKDKPESHVGSSIGTLRGRERVMKNESKRLEQVLQHPQFIADPLAAITRHLQSTLPEPASKKHVDIKGNRKLKKQKKKPNNGK